MANDGEITIDENGNLFIEDDGADVCEDCCLDCSLGECHTCCYSRTEIVSFSVAGWVSAGVTAECACVTADARLSGTETGLTWFANEFSNEVWQKIIGACDPAKLPALGNRVNTSVAAYAKRLCTAGANHRWEFGYRYVDSTTGVNVSSGWLHWDNSADGGVDPEDCDASEVNTPMGSNFFGCANDLNSTGTLTMVGFGDCCYDEDVEVLACVDGEPDADGTCAEIPV